MYQRISSENEVSLGCVFSSHKLLSLWGTPNTEVGSVCKKYAGKSLCFQVAYSISENDENIVVKKAQHCLTEYYFISFPFLICDLQASLILFICPSTHPSIHPSIHLSVNLVTQSFEE